MSAAVREPPGWRRWAGAAVIAFAAAFVVLWLRSTSAWWFEDDPLQFAAAASISHPVSIFIDPGILGRWGTGASLVPMQVLSYWFDTHAFGISPAAARMHDAVATIACAWLLFFVLARAGAGTWVSAAAAALWLCLPATIAVHEFTSARHYMEALAASLLAIAILQGICRRASSEPAAARTVLFFVVAALAMLFKEIGVAAVAGFSIPYAAFHRRYKTAAGVALLVLAYFAYRRALLGPAATYPVPLVSLREYIRAVGHLPFTFAASSTGWVLCALLVAAAVLALAREPGPAARACLLFAGLFAAGLAATYPTAPAILMTYRTPGTWYRTVFLPSTLVLVACAYLLGRFAPRGVPIVALVVLAALLLPAAARTRAYWQARLARSEAEGRFYLAHPDRLVYSEEDADWFLTGLDRLYGAPRGHFISKNHRSGPDSRTMLGGFPTIWRYRDGAWVEDPVLYTTLSLENSGL